MTPILATQLAKRKQGNEFEDRSQALGRTVSKLGFGFPERDLGQIQGWTSWR